MIIKITDNNRVCRIAQEEIKGYLEVDGKTVFEVESVPKWNHTESFLFFNPETKEFHTEPRPAVPEAVAKERERRKATQKRDAALKWLADNDWKVNKHLLGEWSDTDERWLAYLEGREKARAQYDEAEAILNAKPKVEDC